jgi:hypothetical protein
VMLSMESHGGMILTGESRRPRRKTCPNSDLSTTNPAWTDPGANLGLRCECVATRRLSHGTGQTDHLEELAVDGRTISNRIVEKLCVK